MESVAAKLPQATSEPEKSIEELFPFWTRADRSYYSRIKEITAWCDKKFGKHLWYSKKKDRLMYGKRWRYDQMFGYTTFYFAKEKDLFYFILYWGELENDND
jgi:hypothetical protein